LSMARAEVLRASADPARAVLAIDLAGVSGVGRGRLARSLFYFVKTKDLALPDPELSVLVTPDSAGHGMSVRVSARRLARDVYLVADPAPTEREQMFSDNYFDLLPGESVNLDWKGPPQKVIARTIRDSY